MKFKNKHTVAAVAIVSLCLASTPTWAGSKQQHRWEGIVIGVGAAIVGSAIIKYHGHVYHPPAPVRYYHGHRGTYHGPINCYRHGKHRYRGPHWYGKHHHRGHGHFRRYHNRGYHGYQHSPRSDWKRNRHFNSPHRGYHDGFVKQERAHRGKKIH